MSLNTNQSVRYRDLFLPIRRRRRKRNRKTAKMQKTNANKPWEINSGRHVLVLSARYFIYAVLCNSQKSLMRWVIISVFQWRSLLCKGGSIRIFPLLANFKSFPNSMSGRGGHTRGLRLVATWGDEEDPEHLEGSGVPRGKETRPWKTNRPGAPTVDSKEEWAFLFIHLLIHLFIYPLNSHLHRLLWARHCSKGFITISSLNTQNSILQHMLILPPFYRWGNWNKAK